MTNPLDSAIQKIEENSENIHAGSAFAISLSRSEIRAFVKAHPFGYTVIIKKGDK